MNINYVKQDITKETDGLIIHGVNCQGAMGSGVALAIKTKWPEVYEAYKTHKQGKDVLGQVQYVYISDNLYIGNCWTQEFFGNDGQVYADKEAVRHALMRAFQFCDDYNLELKSPKIASGLAGLDWEHDVYPIFREISAGYPDVKVTIFIWP